MRPKTEVFGYLQRFGRTCVWDSFVDRIGEQKSLFSIFGIVCCVCALELVIFVTLYRH